MKAHSPRALLLFWHGAAAAAAQWFQMTETRQKNLPTAISRIFQIKFQQIHLISVSGLTVPRILSCWLVAHIWIT